MYFSKRHTTFQKGSQVSKRQTHSPNANQTNPRSVMSLFLFYFEDSSYPDHVLFFSCITCVFFSSVFTIVPPSQCKSHPRRATAFFCSRFVHVLSRYAVHGFPKFDFCYPLVRFRLFKILPVLTRGYLLVVRCFCFLCNVRRELNRPQSSPFIEQLMSVTGGG